MGKYWKSLAAFIGSELLGVGTFLVTALADGGIHGGEWGGLLVATAGPLLVAGGVAASKANTQD